MAEMRDDEKLDMLSDELVELVEQMIADVERKFATSIAAMEDRINTLTKRLHAAEDEIARLQKPARTWTNPKYPIYIDRKYEERRKRDLERRFQGKSHQFPGA